MSGIDWRRAKPKRTTHKDDGEPHDRLAIRAERALKEWKRTLRPHVRKRLEKTLITGTPTHRQRRTAGM